MHCLFLDLASNQGLLACVDEKRVVASVAIDHRIADRDLVPMIEKLLTDCGWSYPELTKIACVVGPGGFMSLRVGVSLANAMSDALKIPLAGIHLSDLYFARNISSTPIRQAPIRQAQGKQGRPVSSHPSPVAQLLWLHSTKKESLFVRSFGEIFPEWREPTHITLDVFTTNVSQSPVDQSPVAFVGELLPDHRKVAEALGWKEAELRSVEEVLPIFLLSLTAYRLPLAPWYGRGW